jgi:EpsI family protein
MMRATDLAAGTALGAATWMLFREPLASMVRQWDVSPMYSYGYTVPVISGYLIWSQRDQFLARDLQPSRRAGAAVVAAAIGMLALGRIVAIQVLEQLSFVAAVAGLVLFLFGARYTRLAAPAILYLLFMVPLWDVFTEPLHEPFQLGSATLGVAMMQAIDVPVFREGTFITLPNVLIEVARQCSGVNYLVAVLALALPMAFLRLSSPWRRAALIATSLTVAALANGLRVALIGTLAYYDVGSPLHGPFHVLHGLFVAAIGFVVIFAGLRVLEDDSDRPARPVLSADTQGGRGASGWQAGNAFGLATIFCVIAIIGVAPEAEQVALAQPLDSLPLRIGEFTGLPPIPARDPGTSAAVAAWGKADRVLDRVYEADRGRSVRVEVFYFASQRQDHEMVSSTSRDWHRLASRVSIGDGSARFDANLIEWRERKETALFWYESEGHAEAGEMEARLSTIRRSLLTGRTNGAAVVLHTRSAPGAAQLLRDFGRQMRPVLAELWSDGGGAARSAP